ncbi:hypothetical protein [Tenacibaculum discolor]|uniref:hypothetical protein n=1 Tax=Tenacibaculum discolor TaxID=361581 RepID=UPI000F590FEC|nr:hypothetical protein [Tenacibaculum discolor]
MNQHLNIFNPYTKTNRENNQLENDLTRALALTILENDLFCYTFLKYILQHKEGVFEQTTNYSTNFNQLEINIQKKVSSISDFDHLFAVGISGVPIQIGNEFLNQTFNKDYEPITDLFIEIGNTAIIIEIKPNNIDCTSQLYNQIYNIYKENPTKDDVTPVDYNWKKLTQHAIEVNNFQELINKPNRFLNNFIDFLRKHNYSWLPENPLLHIPFTETNINPIKDRLKTIISQSSLELLNKSDRLGFICNKNWADEILIWLNPNEKLLCFGLYPGNTKGQGYFIFKNEGVPQFKEEIVINNTDYKVNIDYHIKFSSFQKYFAGLDFTDSDLNKPFYNRKNFIKYTGRKKRNMGDWDKLETLFNDVFKKDYFWKDKAEWHKKMLSSGKSQFDVTFGYSITVNISYTTISELDYNKESMNEVIHYMSEISSQFENILI